jgi:hypothetical protein
VWAEASEDASENSSPPGRQALWAGGAGGGGPGTGGARSGGGPCPFETRCDGHGYGPRSRLKDERRAWGGAGGASKYWLVAGWEGIGVRSGASSSDAKMRELG